MRNPTQERGISHFVDRADKPNSVPILPTEGGCRIEYPEPVEGLQSFDFAQDARFCSCLRQAKSATIIYLGLRLLATSSGTSR